MSENESEEDLWESRYREALLSWESQDSDRAIEILKAIQSEHSDAGPVCALLGMIYRKSGALEEALEQLRLAVNLLPKSDLAARGLFHTLWDMKKTSEARTELYRFLGATDSAEHRSEWAGLLAQVESHLSHN